MSIILIGMPGAGKSTIGVLLAKALGKRFIDTDIIIQKQENRLLQEIINKDGIDEFLKIEAKAIKAVSDKEAIIATGGSAVYDKESMKHLSRLGTIIYLELSFNEIKRRINNITTRGIAMGKNKSLLDIYKERIPLYQQYSDITINCSNKKMETIVEEIINKVPNIIN